jgi:hypothetical protein
LAGRRPIIALSALVFAVAFLYRFNALLGALGGFDGDHFIYFLGSTDVLRGERPLRDFVDAGLQGAWPALTYELPALAMRLGGESLRSEALLCVGAIGCRRCCCSGPRRRWPAPGPAWP